jgi:MFS family permease
MDTPAEQTPTGAPAPGPREVQLELRTAPKLWPFLGAGIVAAAVVALIVAWFGHEANVEAAAATGETVEFSFGALLGFFFVIFAIVGACVGALAFLLVDRIGRRRAHTVTVMAEPVTEAAEPDEA